jgi:hypothetical protein
VLAPTRYPSAHSAATALTQGRRQGLDRVQHVLPGSLLAIILEPSSFSTGAAA